MLKLASLGLMSALSLLAQSRQLDMTTGYNYQNSDQGQGKRASLNGWFADLQYDLTERLAVTSTCKLVAVWSSSYWTESICRSRRQNNFALQSGTPAHSQSKANRSSESRCVDLYLAVRAKLRIAGSSTKC
jgi:hypothetical protein